MQMMKMMTTTVTIKKTVISVQSNFMLNNKWIVPCKNLAAKIINDQNNYLQKKNNNN